MSILLFYMTYTLWYYTNITITVIIFYFLRRTDIAFLGIRNRKWLLTGQEDSDFEIVSSTNTSYYSIEPLLSNQRGAVHLLFVHCSPRNSK